MNARGQIMLILLLIIVVIGSMSVFTVKQTEQAVRFRFGEVVQSDYTPGLHFKMPFVNTVRKFPRQVLTLDSPPERFQTSEQKYVIVDFFAKWRIDDPIKYYRASTGSEDVASKRLLEILKNGMKSEFASRTLQQVVSAERAEIMEVMTVNANDAAKEFGITILDVRVKQIEMPDEVTGNIYERMKAARKEFATELRAEGAEQAEKVRADADRQRTTIIADSFRDSEKLRGDGDAKAAEIYAQAYGKDADFYSFYRSLQAYRNTANSGSDILVLKPDSDFYRFFNHMKGTR